MRRGRAASYALFFAGWVLWVLAAVNIGTVVGAMKRHTARPAPDSSPVYMRNMALVDQAIGGEEAVSLYSFGGEFESPFRLQGKVVKRQARSRTVAARGRVSLSFKGVLWKESPLAIIEDEQGKTSICKAGDLVHGQKIVKIEPDKITLRDEGGTYTLHAPEN